MSTKSSVNSSTMWHVTHNSLPFFSGLFFTWSGAINISLLRSESLATVHETANTYCIQSERHGRQTVHWRPPGHGWHDHRTHCIRAFAIGGFETLPGPQR